MENIKNANFTIISSNWNIMNKDNGKPIIPNDELKDVPSDYKIYRINSERNPYATETVITKYGSLNSKLGTNLGLRNSL